MDTFIIFIVLGLFIVLTVSLRFIPTDGFGVLEQFNHIHIIYKEPGIHFVIPGVQKMYLYHREMTLDFNRILLAPLNRNPFYVTLTISLVITDIEAYHKLIKSMSIHDGLMKVMTIFIESDTWAPNTMKADLNEHLTQHFIQTTYPFAVSNIDVLELDLA